MINTNRKAIIFGIKGTKLSFAEKKIIKKENPWGIILFSRNIKNLYQAKNLISDIKKCAQDKHFPIIIDQEGGKVSRINNIIDLSIFSQKYFGNLYLSDKKSFDKLYMIYINSVSNILNFIGVNINTVPVLDVLRKSSHDIIGSRSFSTNSKIVKILGDKCVKNFHKNKIATVIKHIPGHGLSKNDSHIVTPIIKSKKKYLIKNDFETFKNSNSFFAMSAHIIYQHIDPNFTATHSRIIIEDIIRKKIGFKGILISDDICMKSLRYGLKENAFRALDSGCNLILHCNSKIEEIHELLKIVPRIDKFTSIKTSQFNKFLR